MEVPLHTGESRFIDVTIRHRPTPNRLTQRMDEQKLLASACQTKQAKYRVDIHCFDEWVDFITGASTHGNFSADLAERTSLNSSNALHQPRRHILPLPDQSKHGLCHTKR